MARKYFEQAADILVDGYARISRPATGFFGLLADKGYLPAAEGESKVEAAIRGMFNGLASAFEAVVGHPDQRGFDFFDLLDAKGYLTPALVPAVATTAAANDNSSDRRAA